MRKDYSGWNEVDDGSRVGGDSTSWFPIFHIPHDGNGLPDELLESVCIPSDVFMAYHEKMRDMNVGALIPPSYRKKKMMCTFPISHLLCDVERFIGPEEVMEQYGMGFCYEKAFDGTIIKCVTEELKKKTRKYYDEHHERINRLCAQHRHILLIDLHSYSDEIIPKSFLRKGEPLPDLCIGVDQHYTPPELVNEVINRFQDAGLTISINYPYCGCYVPEAVMNGNLDCFFSGIMLEYNRNAYLDERGKLILEKNERITEVIKSILRQS